MDGGVERALRRKEILCWENFRFQRQRRIERWWRGERKRLGELFNLEIFDVSHETAGRPQPHHNTIPSRPRLIPPRLTSLHLTPPPSHPIQSLSATLQRHSITPRITPSCASVHCPARPRLSSPRPTLPPIHPQTAGLSWRRLNCTLEKKKKRIKSRKLSIRIDWFWKFVT